MSPHILFTAYKKGRSTLAETLTGLRAYYHAVRSQTRSEVVDVLSEIQEVDAQRELVLLFQECQWRTTQMQIIRGLSRYPNQRSLEFLMRLARNEADIPMSEAAIWSLGQSGHMLAARFLVNTYANCSKLLKPAIIGALGQIPDRTLANDFLAELVDSIATRQLLLVKNLVLTLGNLKVAEALPQLAQVAADRAHVQIRLSALVAIGKISRDPVDIMPQGDSCSHDLFEHQIYASALTQIQFRSQWKLEDYLLKIFHGTNPHPALPLELNSFASEDVKEGLMLHQEREHLERMCFALGRYSHPDISSWYCDLLPLSSLNDQEMKLVLKSMASHVSQTMLVPLQMFRQAAFNAQSPDLLGCWLEALSLCIPGADQEFSTLAGGEDFRAFTASQKITFINHLTNLGLILQANEKRLKGVVRQLETLLESDDCGGEEPVLARLLRALGQLENAGKKSFAFVAKSLGAKDGTHSQLASSAFFFLEKNASKQACQILIELVVAKKIVEGACLPCLKALTAQEALPADCDALDELLKTCLSAQASVDLKLSSLACLAKHPRKRHVNAVIVSLKGEDRLRLAAVLAAKAFQDESLVDALEECLASESVSIVGRTLDALLALPGNRAKRLIIDFLALHAEDEEVCDKVIRALKPPQGANAYFAERIDAILVKFPLHLQREGLQQMRDRIGERSSATGSQRSEPKGVEVTLIDENLSQCLPGYERFDEEVKSALRSAEVPFLRREMFDKNVDKSTTILEYCKAIDMLLEKKLGRALLFPKLDTQLHDFQNLLHAVALNEEYPNAERVMRGLSLEQFFTSESFPVHKMSMVSRGILSGKILQDQWRILDGLRAWAVILLLFAREKSWAQWKPQKALLKLNFSSDEKLVDFAIRLMSLQDLRNPAAHRQTLLQFPAIEEVRSESMSLLKVLVAVM